MKQGQSDLNCLCHIMYAALANHLSNNAFLCLNLLRVHQLADCHCDMSCLELGRLKFVLSNQDSDGGKTCTVLTFMYLMYANRKGIEVWQLFSLETTLDIHENELKILANHIRL